LRRPAAGGSTGPATQRRPPQTPRRRVRMPRARGRRGSKSCSSARRRSA